jgi:nucleoside-triphosphatase
MEKYPSHFLVTGKPGCGKTTFVKNLLPGFSSLSPTGFYPEEVREGKTRVGFRLVSLDGRISLLAHIGFRSGYHVGKYGVDRVEFESFLGTISFQDASLVVIDEIGKMECISEHFCRMIEELLSSEKCLLATIAEKGTPFIEDI